MYVEFYTESDIPECIICATIHDNKRIFLFAKSIESIQKYGPSIEYLLNVNLDIASYIKLSISWALIEKWFDQILYGCD